MRFEIARTFPHGRNRSFEFMRNLAQWGEWMPVRVSEDGKTFTYMPVKGIVVPGTLDVVDEVQHESCHFVMTSRGLPPVHMVWTFAHAGPGAFTLRSTLYTEPKDAMARFAETALLMGPVLGASSRRALDRLEHYFLGDLEVEKEKAPAMAE